MITAVTPIVRLDFMNQTIDSDRVLAATRMDMLEGERLAMDEKVETLAARLEMYMEWQQGEIRTINDNVKESRFAQGAGTNAGHWLRGDR